MRNGRFWLGLGIVATGAVSPARPETLYNGIQLPAEWPPRHQPVTAEPPAPPPYLVSPPAVIPIDLGRQLFVDYFLIEDTNLRRHFHKAQPYAANPVIRPDRPWERYGNRGEAMAFSDGVWYDPVDRYFKAWYIAGQDTATALARSDDGVHWEKPLFDVVPGTNIVLPGKRDSGVVWLDQEEKNPQRRFKFVYSHKQDKPLSLYYSADGIHWGQEIALSPLMGDRTTAFWNPFRKVWVLSLRTAGPGPRPVGGYKLPGDSVRMRHYLENPDLAAAMHWQPSDPVPWVGADRLDPVRIDLGVRDELYNLDAVGYESVMLGLFSIWHGQRDRNVADKPDEISLGFSRDGFHWDRPYRAAFIPVSEDAGAWNHSNVQSVGGGCLVVGDRLYFYMSGRSGAPHGPGDNSTGLATLRRDGFVSMDAGSAVGFLTTRPVRFHGRYLFVNVASADGELRAEVLDANNQPIAPFTLENSVPARVDNTLQAMTWRGGGDLSALAGQPVKFRFSLRDGSLFSFWVSPETTGASHGYVAAGGPGFTGPTDTVGAAIYEHGFARRSLN